MTPDAIIARLREKNTAIALAETITGGLISSWFTDVPGSSAVFPGGMVAYSDEAKRTLLGVQPEIIAQYGAVSAETALAMAHGVRGIFAADVGLASTGIAGPGGARPSKPVGTTYTAVVGPGIEVWRQDTLSGDRVAIKEQAAQVALLLLAGAIS